jgi:hypothetical protein
MFCVAFLDSSQVDGNCSGTLGKERSNKGRKKWGGILSGGKHKHASRHEEESMDGLRALHDSLPKHPLPITIPKEQMVSFFFFLKIFLFFFSYRHYFEFCLVSTVGKKIRR